MVEREAAAVWGINAPTARIAAQIHQESAWNPKAASKYANGLAQFTPPTAKWIAEKFPEQLGDFDPWDPAQAVRAMVIYDNWLLERVPDTSECDRWAFALSGYNGGLGWVNRDRRRASAFGADGARWFGHVDAHSARAGWAIKENRGYVTNILLRWEPAYVAAGWSGTPACEPLP
jgi:membrane-bound lytic murein transglycosylase MltF